MSSTPMQFGETWTGKPTQWAFAPQYLAGAVSIAAGAAIVLGSIALPFIGAGGGIIAGWVLFGFGTLIVVRAMAESFYVRFEIGPEHVRVRSDFLRGSHNVIKVYRIKDLRVQKPWYFRLLTALVPYYRDHGGIGHVVIYALDHSLRTTQQQHTLTFRAVLEPLQLKELISQYMNQSVEKYGPGLLDIPGR